LASAQRVDLSDRVSALAVAENRKVSGEDFDRILQLVRLCPEYDADRAAVRAITVCYRAVHALERLFGRLSPDLTAWATRERANCSHFAAVVLDRSISSSRTLCRLEAGEHP